MLAAHDLGGGEIHRIEARRAEPADLDARHRLAETGFQRREARDVGAGLADRIDHAEHDVVDDIFLEMVALLQRFQRRRRQRQRGHLVQRAIGLAAAARRANVIVDICLRHDSPVRSGYQPDDYIIVNHDRIAKSPVRRRIQCLRDGRGMRFLHELRKLPPPIPWWSRFRSGCARDAVLFPAASVP